MNKIIPISLFFSYFLCHGKVMAENPTLTQRVIESVKKSTPNYHSKEFLGLPESYLGKTTKETTDTNIEIYLNSSFQEETALNKLKASCGNDSSSEHPEIYILRPKAQNVSFTCASFEKKR